MQVRTCALLGAETSYCASARVRSFALYSQCARWLLCYDLSGHYLPSVGYRVLEGNRDRREPKINLQAIAIGNGLVNPKVQYAEYLPFITVQDKLPQSSLDWMAAGLPLCMDAISKCNPDNTTSLTDCLMATATCNLFELIPFQFSGLNVYDVREVRHTHAPDANVCYTSVHGKTCVPHKSSKASVGTGDVPVPCGGDRGRAWS